MENHIYYGDNLTILRQWVKEETVDLCYIDPPFNSERNYHHNYPVGTEKDKIQVQVFKDRWQWDQRADEEFSEIIDNHSRILTAQTIDLIAGLAKVLKKSSLLAYLVSMTLRIAEIHRVLKSSGSFYLHCDPAASHYLKLILDTIFCAQGGEFRNEIIWCYSGGGRPRTDFARKHDCIFRYTKSKQATFNADEIRVNYALDPSKYTSPKSWGSHGSCEKSYSPHPLGKVPEDWWILSALNSQSKERLGYPTQKPEALLERIIKASSNEGDTVLDAYCGCGTTVAVAERLGRNWIGIDITYQSIVLILKRLEKLGIRVLDKVMIKGVPRDFDSAVALANQRDDRVGREFEKWMVLTYSKNQAVISERGKGNIDGIAYLPDHKAKNGIEHKKVLFSVKSNNQSSPKIIYDLNRSIDQEQALCGILLTLYRMPDLVEESRQYGVYHDELTGNNYPRIQVVSVEEMLGGQLMKLPGMIQD